MSYLSKALHEFNMSLPASAPFYKLQDLDSNVLPASVQSRLEDRALELELQDLYQAVTLEGLPR